jgi:uncharacterized membrane protein
MFCLQNKTVPLLPLEMESVCSAEIVVTDYQHQYFFTGQLKRKSIIDQITVLRSRSRIIVAISEPYLT